jgi:hypothetical protein
MSNFYMSRINWDVDANLGDRLFVPAGDLDVCIIYSPDRGIIVDVWPIWGGPEALATASVFFSEAEGDAPDKDTNMEMKASMVRPCTLVRDLLGKATAEAAVVTVGPLRVIVVDAGGHVEVTVTDHDDLDPLSLTNDALAHLSLPYGKLVHN